MDNWKIQFIVVTFWVLLQTSQALSSERGLDGEVSIAHLIL